MLCILGCGLSELCGFEGGGGGGGGARGRAAFFLFFLDWYWDGGGRWRVAVVGVKRGSVRLMRRG